MSVSTSFPDSTYSSSNKPSAETLKADISALEVGQNTHEQLTEVHGSSGNVIGLTTLQAYVPVGVMFDYAGATAPSGFLLCDGSAVSRNTYASLFAVIGETYGAGDASTTFNLPDFRGRVSVMKSTDTEFDALGKTAGAKTHALTETELAAHTHGGATGEDSPDHTHTISNKGGQVNVSSGSFTTAIVANSSMTTGGASARHTHSISSAGSGTAHNNLQPYLVSNKIIKV